jgi:2-iminoacetate synthase
MKFPLAVLEQVLDSTDESFSTYADLAAVATERTFGRARTFFAPLYVSNVCVNDCRYCGYRRSNEDVRRRTLTPMKAAIEATALRTAGVNHILLLAGEYALDRYFDMLLENIRAIREAVADCWLGVEVAPLHEWQYGRLAQEGVDAVSVFQETYNHVRYRFLHPVDTPKGDFHFRVAALTRALRAGIADLGLGVLYGVGKWQADTITMAQHALELLRENPKATLRFSFPRLMPGNFPADDFHVEEVTESMLLKAIVGLRLQFPNSLLILTGRESFDFLLRSATWVNVLGKDGQTAVGGYSTYTNARQSEQFKLNRDASAHSFKHALVQRGYSLN